MTGDYYYDLATGEITRGKVRGATNRMGPYDTREEAEQALAAAAQRNEAWEAEDRAWEDDDA
ncbi:MAG TPA: hypothetical protein VK024_06740 [Actinomycetaceae bacterium]|nr:hypothetical protein [Actinomycetaceae bacterium]